MVGMTVALSVAPGLAEAELGEYRVGYISQDGMRHQVSLADAQAVRFEVMTLARRFAAGRGSGICRAVVVVHGRRSRRVQVMAGTRSPDMAGLGSSCDGDCLSS